MQHVEAAPGKTVYICSECIRKAKDNFIWLCLDCGKSYVNPKQLVISKIRDRELKKAYMLCADTIVIQGIDVCIACNPERMPAYSELYEPAIEC